MRNLPLLVMLLFVLVACGGERRAQTIEPVVREEPPTTEPAEESLTSATSKPEEPDPEPTGEPIATTKPANTPEPTEETSPTPEPEPVADNNTDEEALIEGLLTINDMPTGWAGEATTFEERTPGGTYQFTCTERPARSIAAAEVNFEQSAFGPFLSHSIVVYPDTASATDALTDIISAAQECAEYIDGEGNTITLSPLSFPSFDDQTFAIRRGGVVQADLIYVRINNVIINIYHGGLGAIDSELTEAMVTMAVERYTR